MLPSMSCCALSLNTAESSEVTETEVQQVTVKLSVIRERERERERVIPHLSQRPRWL